MWHVIIITIFVLFSVIALSQGRINLETASDSWDGIDLFSSSDSNFADSGKPPHPVARLVGLQVRDGKMSPGFDANTLNYTVTLSPGVTTVQIMAQVSLGTENEKYKVNAKSKILEPHLVKSPSCWRGNTSVTLVKVKVSAEKHRSVTYYLEVGQASQERSEVRAVMFQILFWTGSLLATGVVGVFVYSIYLALSGGGVTGEGVESYTSRGEEGHYEAVQNRERVDNATT